MNISAPAIKHPIGTTLLAAGLLLLGILSYFSLPVASLPAVNFPVITVSASLPGASPETVATTVTAPLERRLGAIAGVKTMTSTSSLGSTRISVQFELSRDIDSAAQDVQAALNAAQKDLSGQLPNPPRLRKIDPSAFPILILALTSDTLKASDVYDIADTTIAQRIAQVQGVSDVSVTGAEQPAIRVDMYPAALAGMNFSLDAVREAIDKANVTQPLGYLEGGQSRYSIASNDGLTQAQDFGAIVLKTQNGDIVHLRDVADVSAGRRNRLQAGWFDGQPSVLLMVHKTGDANIVKTIERIRKALPGIQRWVPAGIHIDTFSDRTTIVKDSVNEMQVTLISSIILVMLVVLVFLRRGIATLAAGITVPLSLAGTAIAMWLAGYSLNNFSLMALTISVGFVVDDAIVMIENIYRNIEKGMRPVRAAFTGAKQIGFTVVSISVSLIAAFSPLFLMGGIPGRLLREFSMTLVFAIAFSAVISLVVTPMICGRLVKKRDIRTTRMDRLFDGAWRRINHAYMAGLEKVVHQRALMLGLTGLALVAMVALFIQLPKTFIPQGDSDLIIGFTQGATDASFERMESLQKQVAAIVAKDPAVLHVGDSVGSSSRGGNTARMFISLVPSEQRDITANEVINRLRPQLAKVIDARVFLHSIQALPDGRPRQGQGNYHFTLWSSQLHILDQWKPKIEAALKNLPQIEDVFSDRQKGGPQLNLTINRPLAARLGVSIIDIDNALDNAFSQRQISTIYAATNQYRVVLGISPDLQRQISDLGHIYVPNRVGNQVPLSALVDVDLATAPLAIPHTDQFPSADFGYNLAEGYNIAQAKAAIKNTLNQLHPPPDLHLDMDDDNPDTAGDQMLLLIGALVAVYLVLGILYESLIHPLTIISTLPSAAFGAVLALFITGTELSLMPVIGIVLLIGIVKKNGIMLVDFAIEGERRYGWTSQTAILEAARQRLRPITMTTLAAVCGAIPLLLFSGPGSELRRPLGITIIGGLLMSQIMTIYTTPVIYLVMDKFRRSR